jgi:hypothetical protein
LENKCKIGKLIIDIMPFLPLIKWEESNEPQNR